MDAPVAVLCALLDMDVDHEMGCIYQNLAARADCETRVENETRDCRTLPDNAHIGFEEFGAHTYTWD